MQEPEEIGGRRFVAALQVPPHTAPKQNIGKWSLLGALPRGSGAAGISVTFLEFQTGECRISPGLMPFLRQQPEMKRN